MCKVNRVKSVHLSVYKDLIRCDLMLIERFSADVVTSVKYCKTWVSILKLKLYPVITDSHSDLDF